jgi:hypothetical protein
MTAEKRRRRALIDALPWDPKSYLDPSPWRLDREVTARIPTVVRYCKARGCRPTTYPEPCARCGTFQTYGQGNIMAALQWTYRADALQAIVLTDFPKIFLDR